MCTTHRNRSRNQLAEALFKGCRVGIFNLYQKAQPRGDRHKTCEEDVRHPRCCPREFEFVFNEYVAQDISKNRPREQAHHQCGIDESADLRVVPSGGKGEQGNHFPTCGAGRAVSKTDDECDWPGIEKRAADDAHSDQRTRQGKQRRNTPCTCQWRVDSKTYEHPERQHGRQALTNGFGQVPFFETALQDHLEMLKRQRHVRFRMIVESDFRDQDEF